MRIRAPALTGDWLGPSVSLGGTWVLLHFFTAGCINCRHTVAELSSVPDGVTVVGVHSPKFAYEATVAAARSAVSRLGISHPVLHDPGLVTWDAYAVKAWPTLTLIDPDGYVVRQVSGEGHVPTLLTLAGSSSRLTPGLVPIDDRPGGLAALPGPQPSPAGGVLVTLPGRGELAVLDAGGREVRRYGGFNGPQGVHAEAGPAGVVAWVADTGSHRLLRLDLSTGALTVAAGTGEPWRPGDRREGLGVRLSSPWSVTRWQGRLVVALAGTHQLVTVDEGPDRSVQVLAGTGREGLFDGPAREAALAQPSGLAVGPDALWFVDAESSALRRLTPAGDVETVVGAGLFSWGSKDGTAGPDGSARLQHPQGVAVLPDGRVLVADTYNGALRLLTSASEPGGAAVLRTMVQGLEEPVAVLTDPTGLWVAGARVERLPLPGEVC